MAPVYKTTTRGDGTILYRYSCDGSSFQQCPDVNDYVARYFSDFGVAPTDANIAGGNPTTAETNAELSSENFQEPDVFAKIDTGP